MNEIELKEKFNAIIPKDYIEQLRKFEEMKVKFNMIDLKVKEDIHKFLIDNDKWEYEMDGLKVKRVKSSTRKIVDKEKMREEGIYENYLKETPVKESIRISLEYEE